MSETTSIDEKGVKGVSSTFVHGNRVGRRGVVGRSGVFGMLVAALMLMLGMLVAPMASADPTPSPSASTSTTTPAEPDPTAAAPTQAGSDTWSLYALSSNVSGFFGNAMAPGGAGSESSSGSATTKPKPGGAGSVKDGCNKQNCWLNVLTEAASGGDVVGFIDPTMTPGAKNWWASNNSKSSMTVAYDAAKSVTAEGIKPGSATGPLRYMYFGAAIQGLGLDSTSTGVGNNSIFTKLIGGAVVILYLGSSLVDLLFQMVLKILIALNPFQLLYDGVKQINATWANGMVPSGVASWFKGLSTWIGSIFRTLVTLQWALIAPLMLVTTLGMYFLRKNFDHHTAIRKYVTRIVFFTIGIPLVGATYTGSLNALANGVKNDGSATMGATRLVLSTFVDTRDWALGGRFAVPDSCADIAWDSSSNSPAASSQANVRNTALCINSNVRNVTMADAKSGASSNPNDRLRTPLPVFGGFYSTMPGKVSSNVSSYGSADSQNKWNRSMYSTDSSKNGSNVSDAEGSTGGVVKNTVSMLMNYANNEHISGSDFETGIKGYLSALAVSPKPELPVLDTTEKKDNTKNKSGSSPNADILKSWFTSFNDPSKMGSVNANNNMILTANGLRSSTVKGGSDGTNPVYKFTTNNASQAFSCGPRVVSDKGSMALCNLSTLSTYNMLNSEFDSKSVTVYSSGTSTSTGNRMSHNAVSAVGTGAIGWFYKADVLVTLLLFTYIGFSFALMMLVTNIKRSFQVVTSAIGAMTGMLSQISKFVVYACVIILEIVGTLFLYTVFQMLATSLPDAVGSIAAQVLTKFSSTGLGGAAGGGVSKAFKMINESGYVTLAIIGIGIATKIWLMKHARAHRTSFLDTIEVASTRMIEKFIDPGSNGMNSSIPGVRDRSGEAALAGAGGMAGHGASGVARRAVHGAGSMARNAGALGAGVAGGMRHGMGGAAGMPGHGSASKARHLAGAGALGLAGAGGAASLAKAGEGADGASTASHLMAGGGDDDSPIAGLAGSNVANAGDSTMNNGDENDMSTDASGVDNDAVDGSSGDSMYDGDSPSDVEARASEIMDRGYLDEGQDDAAQVDGADGDAYEGDVAEGDVAEGDVAEGDAMAGDTMDGDAADGDAYAGDAAQVDGVDGDAYAGDAADGDAYAGDAAQVDGADGDAVHGDAAVDGAAADDVDASNASFMAGNTVDGADVDGNAVDGNTVAGHDVDFAGDDATMGAAGANGDAVSGDVASGDTVHGNTMSGDALAGDTMSGDTMSGDAVSGDSGVVDGATSADSISGDAVAGDAVAGDAVSSGAVSGDTFGGDATAGDAMVGDGVSVDADSNVVPGSGSSTLHDSDVATGDTVSGDAASTFASGDQTLDSSIADSSIDMGEQSPVDASTQDTDFNGVSGDGMNLGDASLGGAGLAAGAAAVAGTRGDGDGNGEGPASNVASTFADGAAGSDVSGDNSSVVGGFVSDGAASDGVGSDNVASTSNESASSGAGNFNDNAVLDTSQVQAADSGSNVSNVSSGAGDFTNGANVSEGSSAEGSSSSGAGNFNEGAALDTSQVIAADSGSNVSDANNSGVNESGSNGSGSNDSGSNIVNAGESGGRSDASKLDSMGSAFSAGRADAPLSASAVEGASNTSVAAADLGEAVSDLRSGNFGEAARDVAAAGGALFGAREASEAVLGEGGTVMGGHVGGGSNESGSDGSGVSNFVGGSSEGGSSPEGGSSAEGASSEGASHEAGGVAAAGLAAGALGSRVLGGHGGSHAGASEGSSSGESSSSHGGASHGGAQHSGAAHSGANHTVHDSSTSMGSHNGDRSTTTSHVTNSGPSSTHVAGQGLGAAGVAGVAGAAAAKAAGVRPAAVPRPAQTPTQGATSTSRAAAREEAARKRRRRRGDAQSIDPFAVRGGGVSGAGQGQSGQSGSRSTGTTGTTLRGQYSNGSSPISGTNADGTRRSGRSGNTGRSDGTNRPGNSGRSRGMGGSQGKGDGSKGPKPPTQV